MRKSIKKTVATLLAATMTMAMGVSAFADNITIDSFTSDSQVIFTLTGNMTDPGWAPADEANVMESTDYPGVYKATITMPAYDDGNQWMSRFSICGFDKAYFTPDEDGDSKADMNLWNRILLGEPTVGVNGVGNLTQVRIACEEETEVTVYFDSKTYAINVVDSEGNPVEYKIGWVTYDDTEVYYTPAEFDALTFDEYKAALVEADRATDLANNNITEKPNFTDLDAALAAKLAAPPEEEETTEEETTTAEETTTVAETTTTAAATTTSAKQSPKTGDVAPVALLVVLMAAVSVVTVVAKKKEA